MGLEISRTEFSDEERRRFAGRVTASARALRTLLERPGFGMQPTTIGAELELYLVDDAGRPVNINRAVLADVLDGRVALEVNRFNLEINTTPSPLAGGPFTALEGELSRALAHTRDAARAHGAHVVTVGVLPTLDEQDLSSSALTDRDRYRALSAAIRRLRREPLALHIEGADGDVLDMQAHDITFEGANTSFQVHLHVTPATFAATYNAAQIASAPALALAGNSPFFLGRRLWHETRVALFRQAVDERPEPVADWRPARVSFGYGWARHGAAELFEESAFLHHYLLPVCGTEDIDAIMASGGVPTLAELRLHHGTVWRWNRAVYDDALGGHLRIEMRALAAGPTVRDMVANAAFVVGLTRGLATQADAMVTRMTFGHARRNFYAAARYGLDADLLWPADEAPSPRVVNARDLFFELLPVAQAGLLAGGVAPAEASAWLDVVRTRVERGVTGATWQRGMYERRLDAGRAPDAALRDVLLRYRDLSEEGTPVADWPHD